MDDIIAEIGIMPKSPLQVFQAYWQKIDTAPKDGARLLCVSGQGHVLILQWFEDYDGPGQWSRWDRYDYHDWKPTHWMPLPQPPVSE